MSSRHERGWDIIYHRRRPESLPWELGEPRKVLVDLVESGTVMSSKALDLCCGAGTNPIYLAKKGFEVTGLDISDKAVEFAKKQASKEDAEMFLLVADFLNLPLISAEFNLVFDFGCFHHVDIEDRNTFIEGVYRVLKFKGTYLLACFSYKNGPAWNHFTKEQIVELFHNYFEIKWIKHVSSIEGDSVRRYFYEVLMKKSAQSGETLLSHEEP